MGYSQADIADRTEVTAKTVGRWEKLIGIPADKLEVLGGSGFDTQYIVTGVRSGNVPFRDKVLELERVTGFVENIVSAMVPRPDPYKLGPLRDLAYVAGLSEEQIRQFAELLYAARLPDFWLGGSETSGARISQNFYGETTATHISGGDMTINEENGEDYHKPKK